ncbi:hypothetical protein H5410_056442 [Solanum commersonii]|uniref:Uncharacterized protein n=1 Tax=Solanum commersonii TaxID=4109 RepID=A0A9J5WM97_SOLCO|nr:hypothetical protein H5410_056442 [Solanum commersonii]
MTSKIWKTKRSLEIWITKRSIDYIAHQNCQNRGCNRSGDHLTIKMGRCGLDDVQEKFKQKRRRKSKSPKDPWTVAQEN